MPDFGSATFSQNDSSNNSGTMPSWSGSAAPSTLDDAGRALQGAATREWNWRSFTLTAAGTADAKTLTFSVAPAAYYNGQRFAFIANTTNTTSATLNVNSLGAKTIKKDVSGTLTNLSASDMVAGMFVEVAYNTSGDCFVWVNQGNVASASSNTFTANQVISVTDNTNAALRVTQLGTGDAILVEDSANPDSSPFVVTAAGDVGIGATPANKLDVSGAIRATGVTTPTSGAGLEMFYSGSIGYIIPYDRTAATFKSLQIQALDCNFFGGGVSRLTVDSSGNILNVSTGGLGYGTGSGGTVTQLTSKATNVTLNKTNGSITTSNGALANNTTVVFAVFNSTVAATDTIVLNIKSGGSGSTQSAYFCWVDLVAAGQFNVCIRNISGGTLSESLTLSFAVIKAVTS